MSKLTIAALKEASSIIENFYLNAMTEGYASLRSKPRKVPNLPDSKQIIIEKEEWMLTDMWHVTPLSDFSGGATHIYFDGQLIWMLQYFGRYPRSLTPFWSQAHAKEFSRGRFSGGRGPAKLLFKEQGLVYKNHVQKKNFAHFYGTETLSPTVEPANDKNNGWYQYQGGLML